MILQDGIFRSEILPVLHGFTTRQWGNLGFGKKPGDPEVISNRAKLFEAQSITNRLLIQPRQVHSGVCVEATEFRPGVEADASIARSNEYVLSVLTADCVPILAYHPDGICAAIHAGWRGLMAGIIPQTLQKLPPAIIVAIGPAIGPCCYEVGEDLASEFEQKFGKEVVRSVEGRKPHLDLVRAAMLDLQKAGVEEMDVAHLCTACHPDLFFSYRRDGSSGRQMAFITLGSAGFQPA